MYRERAAATIAGAVVWTSRARPGAPPARVLPDGCLDLLWSSTDGLLVAGPDRTAYLTSVAPGQRWLGLRLPPGVGPAVFGVPAHELRDRRVPLDALWGRAADEVTERLGDRPVAAALEAVAAARLAAAGGPDPRGARVAAALAGGATVAATAAEVGLTPRALHRLGRRWFGYGPKTLGRILRMRRALALAYVGVPWAEVAARAGYADQAHLTREVRELAGVPPTVLLTR